MSESVFAYRAKVHRVNDGQRATLLEMAKNSGAFDPAIFDEMPPFFWSAEISNDQVDAYSTWMMDSTLTNFAEDCRTGVAFLNSHEHDELPFGRSLNGVFEIGGDRKRVVSDFFTLPGVKLGDVETDNFITGVRAGIIKDVSVGFYGGNWWCDVCGGNYQRYDSCQHFAGQKIETQNGIITVTVGIDGARLSEVSAVYDGATPDATILKARYMAEHGELDPKVRATIENRYRVRLPEVKTFAIHPVELQRSNTDLGEKMDFEKVVSDVRAALNIAADADVVGAVTSIADQAQRLRSVEADRDALTGKLETEQQRATELDAKVKELEPLAEDGRAYREDLVTEALSEGVRAYGEKFDADTYRSLLANAPLATVKRMKADWQTIGDKAFPGGRKSADKAENAKQPEAKRVIDESAYKA